MVKKFIQYTFAISFGSLVVHVLCLASLWASASHLDACRTRWLSVVEWRAAKRDSGSTLLWLIPDGGRIYHGDLRNAERQFYLVRFVNAL